MIHFPWLHFHLAGSGRYVRGETHVVDFTSVPFFARGFNKVDLSALDPCIWPRFYTIRALDSSNGLSAFSLRPRKIDPQDENPLVEAVVMLDSAFSTREVVLHYANGSITLDLTPAFVQGYRLPVSGEASIDLPGRSLRAHADFTNYTIVATAADSTHAIRRLERLEP